MQVMEGGARATEKSAGISGSPCSPPCCECLPRGREFSKPCQACSALRAGVEAVSGADRRKSNRCSFGQRFVE